MMQPLFMNKITPRSQLIFSMIAMIFLSFLFFNRVNAIGVYSFSFEVLIGICIYLISQLIRSIRLWFILSNSHFSTSSAFTLQLLTSALSAGFALVIGEIVKVVLYRTCWKGNYKEMALAIIFIRVLDIIFVFTLYFIIHPMDSPIEPIFLFIILAAIFILVSYSFFNRLANTFITYFVKYQHTKSSIKAVCFIDSLIRASVKIRTISPDSMIVLVVLSILSWSLELVAILFVLNSPNPALISAFTHLWDHLGFIKNSINLHAESHQIYSHFFLLISVVGVILIGVKLCTSKKNRRSV